MNRLALLTVVCTTSALVGVPAFAQIARRCDDEGCAYVRCFDQGNRCYRTDTDELFHSDEAWDSGGYDHRYDRFLGYDRSYAHTHGGAWYGGYANYPPTLYGFDSHGYDPDGGYAVSWRGWHYRCDSDGEHCMVQRAWNDD